jgi:hypothetical protein
MKDGNLRKTIRKLHDGVFLGQVLSFIAFGAAIIIFLISFPDYSELPHENIVFVQSLFWSLISLMVAFGVGLTADFLSRIHYEQQVSQSIENQRQLFLQNIIASGSEKLVCIGRGTEAVEIVAEKLKGAKTVRNTFIHYKAISVYPIEMDKILEAYNEVLSKAGSDWHDIFSEDTHSINRRDTVLAALEGKHNYRWYVVSPMPAINMVMYGTGSKAKRFEHLFFGWGYHTYDPDGLVFYTEDENVIEAFYLYFQSLAKSALERGVGTTSEPLPTES